VRCAASSQGGAAASGGPDFVVDTAAAERYRTIGVINGLGKVPARSLPPPEWVRRALGSLSRLERVGR